MTATATTSVTSDAAALGRSREILNDLIRERHELRARMADDATLEANRLAIVYWHQHLSRALIQSNSG